MWCRMHPFWTGCIIALLYLGILQRHWMFSGDLWAENQAEYLDEAIRYSFSEVIMPNWAGYLTILPSLLAKLYVVFEGPLGYSDYFFRAIDVVFIVLCGGAIVSTSRGIIQPYGGRLLLSLACIATITDPAMATYCNVWYVGFVPLLLAGINQQPYTRRQQWLYAVGGAAMALCKPALVLVPSALWRMIKTKEYTTGFLVLISAAAQTTIMLVADPRGIASEASRDIWTISQAVFTGSGVAVWKLFQATPHAVSDLYIANIVLFAMVILASRKLGYMRTLILLICYMLSVYVFVLAPDAPVFTTTAEFATISRYMYKPQRELPIYTLLVVISGVGLAYVWHWLNNASRRKTYLRTSMLYLLLSIVVGICWLYHPIANRAPGMQLNVDSFRLQLTNKQPLCMPLPPNGLYIPEANWLLNYQTFCANPQAKFTVSDTSIPNDEPLVITSYYQLPLRTVGLVVAPENPSRSTKLTLTDLGTNQVFYSTIDPSHHKTELAVFYVGLIPDRGEDFKWSLSSSQPVRLGTFTNGSPALYGYFGVDE